MGRVSNREAILSAGLKVLRQRGYLGSSVRDISEAAGVPLGSFTNHFKSKEAFTLEVLDIYFERSFEVIKETLLNESLPPLDRVMAFIDHTDKYLNADEEWCGCLIGNLSVEASDHSEIIRLRLEEISREGEKALSLALKAAVKAGDLPKSTDCNTLAGFILFAQHGAYLQSRVDRNSTAIDRLKQIVNSHLLKKQRPSTHPR
ncbi:MAG: Transcriptional regulator, TetR family [Cyanobacteria bacterium RYN_339]|nr:Transcriptional regulator, TetR family [Cyanobacteria bacterium RYN_339]